MNKELTIELVPDTDSVVDFIRVDDNTIDKLQQCGFVGQIISNT